jgi:hypothetical protein
MHFRLIAWFLCCRPVGHTHNGVDAIHKIHNQDLGNFVSATLGVHTLARHSE